MHTAIQIEIFRVLILWVLIGHLGKWTNQAKLYTAAHMVTSFASGKVTSDAGASDFHANRTDTAPVLVTKITNDLAWQTHSPIFVGLCPKLNLRSFTLAVRLILSWVKDYIRWTTYRNIFINSDRAHLLFEIDFIVDIDARYMNPVALKLVSTELGSEWNQNAG